MIRFLRSHISSSAEHKHDDISNYFHYSKVCSHGFPQKASCFAVDESLGLLAIGTKDGKVRIVGSECEEWSATTENALPISHIYLGKAGSVIALCFDAQARSVSFHCFRISNECLSLVKVVIEERLKETNCCRVWNCANSSSLLIGMRNGDVSAIDFETFQLSSLVEFESSCFKSIDELTSYQSHSIDQICGHPTNVDSLFLVFNSRTIVVYNQRTDEVTQIHTFSPNITHVEVDLNASSIVLSHTNGTYSVYNIENKSVDKTEGPFGPYECTPIIKISSALSKNSLSENVVCFSGGMPKASYGDRYTVTAICGEKEVVFDFTSPVLDFVILHSGDRQCASMLAVLCEEELVAIDLEHPLWRCYRLPYFYPLHSSPVTFVGIYSNIAEKVLKEASERHDEYCRQFSLRQWPLHRQKDAGDITEKEPLREHTLLLTGHENGAVNVWDVNRVNFIPLITYNTARDFEGFVQEEAMPSTIRQTRSSLSSVGTLTSDEDDADLDWPPFRKVGLFDPFCDDTRLSVMKASLNTENGDLIVGGRSGQAMVYALETTSKDVDPVETIAVDMTEGAAQPAQSAAPSRTVRNKERPLSTRSKKALYPVGYQPLHSTLVQFNPVTPVVSLAWHPTMALLAVGNEFGYTICNMASKEILVKNSLISSQEIIEISNLDGALSRFKSVKKSIRQSFRRKKRAADRHGPDNDGTDSVIGEFRNGERQVASRSVNPNVLGGEPSHSVVKVLRFIRCVIGSGARDYYAFVGTSGGVVLIHSLSAQSAEQNGSPLPLVKEIRLQHRAPVVHIDVMHDSTGCERLFIFTEEQIRAFILPGLKSARFKSKLTATEGAKIRKAQIVGLSSSGGHGHTLTRHPRPTNQFLAFISNQGEVFVMSPFNSKRYVRARFTKPIDASGIAHSVLSPEGELFYPRPGGSEIQRCTINPIPNPSLISPFASTQTKFP